MRPSPRSITRRAAATAAALATALLLAGGLPLATHAETAAELYAGADLALGERLMREHECEECHIRNVGGNGTSIYRPKGRINTPAALRGMVEECNLRLNLQLLPDEVTSIAAVLNRDHYKFR